MTQGTLEVDQVTSLVSVPNCTAPGCVRPAEPTGTTASPIRPLS